MTSPHETFDVQMARRRMEDAEAREQNALQKRDLALAELAQLKRDVNWMMEKGLIRDILFQSQPIPASTEPPALFEDPDPEDTERIRWLNQHGRVCAGERSFSVSFDIDPRFWDAELPTPYNIRHLIDLCRYLEKALDEEVGVEVEA